MGICFYKGVLGRLLATFRIFIDNVILSSIVSFTRGWYIYITTGVNIWREFAVSETPAGGDV